MKKGYTLAEMLVVMAIISILALVSMANFVGRRNHSQLTSTTAAMAALLREAQSKSVAQAQGSAWGVRFDNGPTPFFSLFPLPYVSSSHAGYYPLPGWVAYVTSTIAQGSSAEVTFSQISGAANGSSSIAIYLISSPQQVVYLSISSAGAVSY